MTFNYYFQKFFVLLKYSEQDQEFFSCSCSLPSRPHFLVSYSSLPLCKVMIPGSPYPLLGTHHYYTTMNNNVLSSTHMQKPIKFVLQTIQNVLGSPKQQKTQTFLTGLIRQLWGLREFFFTSSGKEFKPFVPITIRFSKLQLKMYHNMHFQQNN